VTPPGSAGRFGSRALKVRGSIFAMVVGGHLVVKRPATGFAELIADGRRGPFDAGKGRPMKEWLTVLVDDPSTWRGLAEEALEFVGG
jgi:hypothetical protein